MASDRRICLRFADGQSLAASADDVVLMLEYLEAPQANRQVIAAQVRRLLGQTRTGAAAGAPVMTCSRPWGSYVILPRKFAAWLSAAMSLPDAEASALHSRLTRWLAGDCETACCATEPVGMRGK